ncbi:hypothetical protein SLEP1_g50920 [Rubroshorea leprosula]|uniref:Uncharacterized protein n=1 Tax=Rubroshorea leprosula TaxID=152421 RepID=A0AAV5M1J9_9ROSI|nr:hypothetical protein SLEP1_g50919 [Rubroshorea leprosula]GKV43656.1 hypothetical protein SLEP1_g50920 [Rubroshorea leprosula]
MRKENGGWSWNWYWRRSLFTWAEELLEELCRCVSFVVLQERKKDGWWQWSTDI